MGSTWGVGRWVGWVYGSVRMTWGPHKHCGDNVGMMEKKWELQRSHGDHRDNMEAMGDQGDDMEMMWGQHGDHRGPHGPQISQNAIFNT